MNAPSLPALLRRIRRCRICVDDPRGAPLPHEPRPVVQAAPGARLAVYGQAPGRLVHESGRPFTDPSGVRLRDWMGVDEATFHDASKVAVIPMGFCYPGTDDKGADRPPRRECPPAWRAPLMAALAPQTSLLVGAYAQRWHLREGWRGALTDTVRAWRDFAPAYFPLPHPSWRNNAWLKKNPWFETEVLPALRARIAALLN